MLKPLKKILIANRGEIALRILRSAKEYGLLTVCIFSDEEKQAKWIQYSDESYSLGGGNIQDTYLNIGKIISIAKLSGADCIHPGYGFLSENHLFAEACSRENITYIGPSVEVLKLAGNKPAALDYVQRLGIPVSEQIIGSGHDLLSLAPELNYPLMVKSAAGGGGKGMRLVNSFYEMEEALKTTSSEALHYFGTDRIYIEKYFHPVRHVEVQILGDHLGNIIHLFDRECSIQRRNQKVIEEAPVAFLSYDKRNEVIQAALIIANSLNYSGAGTIEFLVSENGEYRFLEINPRLQVEHGVTEMVTGIDIVREQISVAAGNPLGIKHVTITGHAVEARIYAEDPENNFLPSPGTLSVFKTPSIPGVRIETSFESNVEIPGDFDPLIAKIIVHDTTRDSAINKLQVALQNFHITGCRHNIALLNALLQNSAFRLNKINTRFLADNLVLLLHEVAHNKVENRNLVILAGTLKLLMSRKSYADSSPWHAGYWRNTRHLRLKFNNEIVDVSYTMGSVGYALFIENSKYFFDYSELSDNQICFTIDGNIKYLYPLKVDENEIQISDGHHEYTIGKFLLITIPGYDSYPDGLSDGGDLVVAPQPGIILDIRVEEGQMVNPGDDLLVIESMKLENTILAGRKGQIKKIAIKTGDKVKKNEPLIFLQETLN